MVIHNYAKDEHCRIPDLEKQGFVEIVSADWRPRGRPLKTQWQPTKHDKRAPPPKQLLQSLVLVRRHLPLIVNRLISKRALYFIDILADWIGVSRRRAAEMFIDYAILYAQGDPAAVRAHPLDDVLAPDLKSQLFDFSDESPMNMTLVMAIVFAEEIADKALRWMAYFAVPATVAETLLTALPVISFTLTIIGAAGAAASRAHREAQRMGDVRVMIDYGSAV